MRRIAFPLLLLLAGCSAGPSVPPPAGDPNSAQVALTDGMRVTGTGWIVAVPDRPIRFCGNPVSAYPPEPVPAPAYCDAGVDVVGIDLNRLEGARTKDGATEGRATLTGTFTGGVLTVDKQDPPTNPQPDVSQEQPCPEPAAGWPDGNLTPEGAKAYHGYAGTHPDKVIFINLLRPIATSQIMGVAVQDEAERAEAERLLRPALGDALCIVDAKWSQAELDAAREDPDLQLSDAGSGGPVYAAGTGSDGGMQPTYQLSTVRVTPQLRTAADRHPAGLVVFEPDLRPV